MLYKIYKKLNLSNSIKVWLKKNLPLYLTRQSHFRRCGSISELYFWVVDDDVNTVVPIQNFFSIFFPSLNTGTTGTLWVYDEFGNEIFRESFSINRNAIVSFDIKNLLNIKSGYGSLMWKIDVPAEVLKMDIVRKNKIYFADRGYISYVKNSTQSSFIHGVDRYAVFQYNNSKFDNYYKVSEENRVWVPEFPVDPNMQKDLKLVMINRSRDECEFQLQIFSDKNILLGEEVKKISARGVCIFNVRQELLDGSCGHLKVKGLSTPWGRPAVFRSFENGSISLMHC